MAPSKRIRLHKAEISNLLILGSRDAILRRSGTIPGALILSMIRHGQAIRRLQGRYLKGKIGILSIPITH